jgi:hypothetical protein
MLQAGATGIDRYHTVNSAVDQARYQHRLYCILGERYHMGDLYVDGPITLKYISNKLGGTVWTGF